MQFHIKKTFQDIEYILETIHNTLPVTPLTAVRNSKLQHGTLSDETHKTTQWGTQQNKQQQ
jgi:hypothetical protein